MFAPRLVQTEQLFIIKEFALEEQTRGLPQKAKQDPRIGGTNNFRGYLAHWPALPVTNLALEDLLALSKPPSDSVHSLRSIAHRWRKGLPPAMFWPKGKS